MMALEKIGFRIDDPEQFRYLTEMKFFMYRCKDFAEWIEGFRGRQLKVDNSKAKLVEMYELYKHGGISFL